MDPTANLKEQLELAESLLEEFGDKDEDNLTDFDHDVARLAELVLALDCWISGGGFLPNQWSKK